MKLFAVLSFLEYLVYVISYFPTTHNSSMLEDNN